MEGGFILPLKGPEKARRAKRKWSNRSIPFAHFLSVPSEKGESSRLCGVHWTERRRRNTSPPHLPAKKFHSRLSRWYRWFALIRQVIVRVQIYPLFLRWFEPVRSDCSQSKRVGMERDDREIPGWHRNRSVSSVILPRSRSPNRASVGSEKSISKLGISFCGTLYSYILSLLARGFSFSFSHNAPYIL